MERLIITEGGLLNRSYIYILSERAKRIYKRSYVYYLYIRDIILET